MSTKVEAQSSSPLPISFTSATVDDLPDEIMLSIFQSLDLPECLSSRLTCWRWEVIVNHPNTIYGKYTREIDAIKKLPFLAPKFSAWENMPRHWGLYTKKNVLKFSSCSNDIITFYPPFCNQSSKFFSFSAPIPSDRYVFLAKYGDTYFLTEQSQTRLLLTLPTDLQPLASYKLITKNFQDPSKNKTISLLRNLPATPKNLSRCQVEYCFPISESNVAVFTTGGEVSFWDLSGETPICYQNLQTEGTEAYKVGDHLVLDNKIINIATQAVVKHELTFLTQYVKTCASALCTHDLNSGEIRYFSVNRSGLLEKQWDFNAESLLERLIDRNNGVIESFYVKDMSEQYIVLTCWQSKALNLLVLSSNGEVIHTICQKIEGEKLEQWELYQYPHFSHLSGNMLIYKHPQTHTLYFWHLPTKKLIQELEWEKLVYDEPLYTGSGFVQDVRLHEGKLTILLSSQHNTPGSNKPGKFRIIQFDPQFKQGTGWMSSIYATVKGLYYSFPGKVSY